MILLDTNVISEPLKPGGEPNVLAWIDEQTVETLYLSTITLAELRFGIAVMPDGKRKSVLQRRLEEEVVPIFEGRILSFDVDASKACAEIFAVATRDTRPFDAAGCEFINPWEHGRDNP